MALNDLIRKGLQIADKATSSLQATVQHAAFIKNDGEGGYLFATPIPRLALIERKQKAFRNKEGDEVVSTHVVTILRPVDPNGAAGRQEPIDPRDVITIPDGSASGILHVETIVDPAIGAGYYHQVWMN